MRGEMRELCCDVGKYQFVFQFVRSLTEEHLRDLGVRILHGYPDGVEGRHFGMAEIGHFLNHFKIWVNVWIIVERFVVMLNGQTNRQTDRQQTDSQAE